jgi:hypothetical protein
MQRTIEAAGPATIDARRLLHDYQAIVGRHV